MSRRRFFVPLVRHGIAELQGADAEHLVRVLRVQAGQIFEISDNAQAYIAEVESARKSCVVFRMREELPHDAPVATVTLCAGLIKFERFEWLIEKATELGVFRIVPFSAVRSEQGLLQASQKRAERWRKVALEASQQSRRTHLPLVESGVPARAALAEKADVRLFLDEESADPILDVLPATRTASDSIALLLGPEGGWTEGERELAQQSGWLPCSLGPTILRAETAAASALAIVNAAWQSRTGSL